MILKYSHPVGTGLAPVRNKPTKIKQLSVTIKLKFTLNIPLPPQRELLSVAKLRELKIINTPSVIFSVKK